MDISEHFNDKKRTVFGKRTEKAQAPFSEVISSDRHRERVEDVLLRHVQAMIFSSIVDIRPWLSIQFGVELLHEVPLSIGSNFDLIT